MKNPWETGQSFYGIRTAWCTASDRMEAAKTMRAEKLKACLQWPDTQKSVKDFITRRLKKINKEVSIER